METGRLFTARLHRLEGQVNGLGCPGQRLKLIKWNWINNRRWNGSSKFSNVTQNNNGEIEKMSLNKINTKISPRHGFPEINKKLIYLGNPLKDLHFRSIINNNIYGTTLLSSFLNCIVMVQLPVAHLTLTCWNTPHSSKAAWNPNNKRVAIWDVASHLQLRPW